MLLWFERGNDRGDTIHSRVHEVGIPQVRARLRCSRTISVALHREARSAIETSQGWLQPGRELLLGPEDWLRAGDYSYLVRVAYPTRVAQLPRPSGTASKCRQQRPWRAVLTLEDGNTRVLNGRPIDLYGVTFRKADDGRQVVVERHGRRIQSRGQQVKTNLARFGDQSTILVEGRVVTISFRES